MSAAAQPETLSPECTFVSACVMGPDQIWLAAVIDALPERSCFTRLFELDRRREKPWKLRDLEIRDARLARYLDPAGRGFALAVLSDEGQVLFLQGEGQFEEDIPDAGLRKPTSKKIGYLSDLRQVASHLYACGVGGQVYRRAGRSTWEHADEGLVHPGDAPAVLLLCAVDGPAEDDLYVAGDVHFAPGPKGRVYHWDGASWRLVSIPPVHGINSIFVESEDRIWLAGLRGALLVGNHEKGFEHALARANPHLFLDVTRFQGTLYLASTLGLFRYDEERKVAVRVRTGLATELSEVSFVDGSEGVLWVVGPKEIARFDGEVWVRIQHPDNPKVK